MLKFRSNRAGLLAIIGFIAPFAALAEPSGNIVKVYTDGFVGAASAEVVVTVVNTGDDSNPLIVETGEVPSGWDIEPTWIQLDVATGDTETFTFVVTPPSDGGSGVIEWELYYDVFGPFNTLLDSHDLSVTSGAEAPDLLIESIVLDPLVPAVGNTVDIIATIKNAGGDSVSSVLCLGGDIAVHFTHNGELLDPEQLSCGLDAGDTDEESVSITVESHGTHTIEVTVDPENLIEEANETNNTRTITFATELPALTVSPNLPAVSAPGLKDVIAAVVVRNDTDGTIKDMYLSLEVVGKTGKLDIGSAQGANLSPGEEKAFDVTVDMGSNVATAPFKPGLYTWRYQVFAGGLPPHPSSLALTQPKDLPFEVVPTVEVTEDNIIVPTVDPVAVPVGATWSSILEDILYEGELYQVTLGFSAPVDFLADGSLTVFDRLAFADVQRASGQAVCDPVRVEAIVTGILLWRDLVAEHVWYRSTYIAMQEGYDWYKDEKNLKVAFWITQPFVVAHDLISDATEIGGDIADWVKAKAGFGSEAEEEAGVLAFESSMLLTKGYETLTDATRAIVKLSPLFAGEAYISESVISERLLIAIDEGGNDLQAAIELIHEVMKSETPEDYEKITQIITPGLVLNAIGNVLGDGIKAVLVTGVTKGFTAYFISKLSAKTAWKIAIGEGQATLMGGLTTAGIAKGIASFGLTLIITIEIAYLTYVGTFLDNIRGPGGLIEAGQIVAQSIPWTHVLYTRDGKGGPLDIDSVEDTFMAHAVLFEVYGFINSDLAMLKKLVFAKTQSQEYVDRTMSLFEVSKHQREFASLLQAAATGIASPTCGDDVHVEAGERSSHYQPPDRSGVSHRTEWTKPEGMEASVTEADTQLPDDVWWVDPSDTTNAELPGVPDEVTEGSCQAGSSSSNGAGGVLFVLGAALFGLRRRRRMLLAALVVALSFGCSSDDTDAFVAADTSGTTANDGTTGVTGVTDATDATDGTTSGDATDGTSATDGTTATDVTDGTDGTSAVEGTDGTGGSECACDDDNDCTIDTCDEEKNCKYTPKGSAACQPVLTLTAPPRGAVFTSGDAIEVSGSAMSAAGIPATVTVNGQTLPVNPNGQFTAAIYPDHGITVITVEAKDTGSNTARIVQAALVGDSFYPTHEGPSSKAVVNRGLVAWLGAEALDDDDTTDIDDFATIAAVVLNSIDFFALIPQPLLAEGEEPGIGWCEWTVVIDSLDFKIGPVDFVPADNGLVLLATIEELVLAISVTDTTFGCPDVVGTITVPTISVNALVELGLEPGGGLKVDIPTVEIEIVEPTIDITSGVLSFFDWIFNWFNNQFASLIEVGIEGAVKSFFGPALQDALAEFTIYETDFTIPALPFIGNEPTAVTIGVAPTEISITPAGVRFALGARVTAPNGLPEGLEMPGSIARNGCLGTQQPMQANIPMTDPMALALHDDLLNQILFAAYYSGLLHANIDGKALAEQIGLDQFEIGSVVLNPLLPPVLTSCTLDGSLEIQLGDLGVAIDLVLNEKPGNIEAFLSGSVRVKLGVSDVDGAAAGLKIEVIEVADLGFQVVDASGALDGSETIVDLLMSQVLVDLISNAIGAGFVQNIPVPSIDLGTLVEAIPEGTNIGFTASSLGLSAGYTVLSGGLTN